ncbi:MAG TPA: DUF4336 domain-containing protein [Chroococcidiopsis sp.]
MTNQGTAQPHDLSANSSTRDWSWRYWPVVPLYPYGQRRTLCTEVIPNTIWTFDQIQGVLYVTVPIRMTVVRLAAGGLLVYAPVAPTPECIRMVRSLEAIHGAVKYIILPTVSGIEHKVFVGPFARQFSTAQVYVAPHQWSFPLNLPLSWLGLPLGRTHVLPADSSAAPFADEFDYAILGPIDLGLGPFEEVAFYHRASRSLLVTDSVVSVPEDPPAIVQLDPYPLLFHARDDVFERVIDSPEARRKGWQRISLFAFYFRPSAVETVPLGQAVRQARHAFDRSKRGYFGLFPFQWRPDWAGSFEALRGGGRPFVAPILQQLILNRAPRDTLAWVNRVSQWDFEQILPCHFASPIAATPPVFQRAFSFLQKTPPSDTLHYLPEADFELLKDLERGLLQRRLTPPPQDKV